VKKALSIMLAVIMIASLVTGCSEQTKGGQTPPPPPEKSTITVAWYPNESGAELADARKEIGMMIEKATGKKVEHKTTTDYLIVIEAIVNGNVDIAYTGAEGYIQAHNKNNKVVPLFVNSGSSGTLDDATYYAWLCVRKGEEDQYKDGDTFKIDNIQDKKFSFVSNSSTSGFRVPSAGITNYFTKMDSWKNLTVEDLLEAGSFFSEVLFGGSHQGSAVNLLSGRADVAAVCDTCIFNYIEHISGTHNRPGAVYRVKDDADEPFNTMPGKEFVVISSTPVLNAPFIYNSESLSAEDVAKILSVATSDEVANNEKIFVPKDSQHKGLYRQGMRFLKIEDSWFNPIRALSAQ